MSNPLLDAALEYAGMGFAVFPCAPRGKTPLTRRGFQDATKDQGEIEAWWARWPSANIGIATGAASGIVVLDIDNDDNTGVYGSDSLRLWESEFGELPETWMSLTGGGGVHYIFQAKKEVRNRAGVLEGIDVRGDGGYIIAPPSIHESGRRYEWEASREYLDAPASLPEDLYLLMVQRGGSGQKFEMPEQVTEGRRNDILFRCASSLQAKGLSDTAILAAVKAENSARCDPPLPDREVAALVESALRYDKGEAPEVEAERARETLDKDAFSKAELMQESTFEAIYKIKDRFEQEQYIVKLREAARKHKCINDFNALLSAFKRRYVQRRKQQGSNTIKFTDCPVPGLKCKDWICDDLGVRRIASRGEESHEEWACPHPVLPVERLCNVETDTEKIRLAYCKDGAWRSVIANMTTVANRNRIVELAEYGIAVTTENARWMVEYLHDVLNLNLDLIPRYQSIGRMGWYDGKFSPYIEDIKFDGDIACKEYFEAVSEHGDYDLWKAQVWRLRKDNPLVKIILGASFASPIIEPLHKLPFFVHLYANESGTGKTVAVMMAMSVWGNPDVGKLVKTFSATNVGMERTAAVAYSIPTAYDELQTIKGDNFDKMVYFLCEGVGKIRGNIRGGVDTMARWRNCFLTTGEQPLTNVDSGAGAKNRVLNIECVGQVLPDAPEMAAFFQSNYGFAGREIVNALSGELEGTNLTSLYEGIFNMLPSDTTEKQRMAAAMVMLGDRMMCEHVFGSDEYMSADDIAPYLVRTSEIDVVRRAHEWLWEWVIQNKNKFQAGSDFTEMWGRFQDLGESVAIIRKVFDDALTAAGFHPQSIVRGLRRNGLINLDSYGKSTRIVKIDGQVVRCVVLRRGIEEIPSTDEVKTPFEDQQG